MGKLNTSYGSYCYDSGTTLFNRAVSKYLRNCGTQSDCSGGDVGESDGGGGSSADEAALEFGRIVCGALVIERPPRRPVGMVSTSIIIEQPEQKQPHPRGTSLNQEDELAGGHVVELIDESRVSYRAEGNANIVLALDDKHHVLRLRKSSIKCRKGKDAATVDLPRFIKYSQVISSFFSHRFVPQPKLARLNTYDLTKFNQSLTKFRPVTRLDKEIQVRDGILYPDVAFLPNRLDSVLFLPQDFAQDARGLTFNTYCVEIKPKQGWSFHDECFEDERIRRNIFPPNCDNSALPELTGASVGKCRYCLFQYLKLQKKSIEKVSKYCPLDLFSGKPIRMLHAVKGLIGAPQNNFKLSKNGQIVYNEKQEKSVFNRILREIFARDGRTKEERKTIFMNLVKEILLKDFSSYEAHCDRRLLTIRKDRKKKDKNLIHERTCSPINYQFLPKNCALKQILDTQLLVKTTLAKMHPNRSQQAGGLADPFVYIDELYEKYLDCLEDCSCCGDSEGGSKRTTIGKLKHFIKSYLDEEEKYQLGATALDCSIMITFRRLADREEDRLTPLARNHVISIEGMKFLTNVTITDLDPKSLNHHKKYLGQLQDSVAAYREFMSKLKR